jgi:hypothetical protein
VSRDTAAYIEGHRGVPVPEVAPRHQVLEQRDFINDPAGELYEVVGTLLTRGDDEDLLFWIHQKKIDSIC